MNWYLLGRTNKQNLPSCDVFDCPEVEGAHRNHQYVAKCFIVIKYAKKHIEYQCQHFEEEVEEAHCGVCGVLNKLWQILFKFR